MFDAIHLWLETVLQNVRPADVADVLLVSVFIYSFLTWLRTTTARDSTRRVLIFVASLGLLYGVARRFEMTLMETTLEVVLLGLALVAAVVFQTDFRRIGDRLGSISLRRPTTSTSRGAQAVEVLTETAARLAAIRRGALIAIRGREPWDRYVEGGILLEGRASLPLLVSLFNPTSPGHDGAVMMEGERIRRFSAHLPLSAHSTSEDLQGGTRHAAALGLAEQCDAFVIVVSEERGAISVAHDGVLTPVSASELKAALLDFWERHYSRPTVAQATWWRSGGLPRGTLSIALAALLWLLFVYRPDTVVRTWTVPLEFRNLSAAFMLEGTVPTEARVTLTGAEQAFRGLDPASLVLSLDLAGVEEGLNEFVVAEDHFSLPTGVDLANVVPQTVRLQVQRLRLVRVPVVLQPMPGTLADSLRLVSLQALPDSVTLVVPDDARQLPVHALTERVDLSSVEESTTLQSRLIPPEGARLQSEQSPDVEVAVVVEPKPAPSGNW